MALRHRFVDRSYVWIGELTMIALLSLLVCDVLAAPLSPGDAVALSIERSVDVAEAAAVLERTRGRARAAGLLANDPQVEASWAVDLIEVSASQRLSLSGRGIAERRSAVAAVHAAEARLRRAEVELAAEVRMAWVGAVETQQTVKLAEEAMGVAAKLREGAERRLEAGEAALLDVRLARVEEAEAVSIWMSAVSAESEALAELAAFTGLGVADIELGDDLLEAAPAWTDERGDRSDVEAARYEVESARAALSRERAATVPDVTIGAFYEEEGAEQRIGPSVGLTLPLWRRNTDGRAHARANLNEADARLAELDRRAEAESDAGRHVMQRFAAVADPQLDVQAEASAALASIALAYDSGELDLLTAALLRGEILEGQRAWLEGQRVLAHSRITLLLAEEHPSLLAGP